jgi:hypothetical protein
MEKEKKKKKASTDAEYLACLTFRMRADGTWFNSCTFCCRKALKQLCIKSELPRHCRGTMCTQLYKCQHLLKWIAPKGPQRSMMPAVMDKVMEYMGHHWHGRKWPEGEKL